MPCVRNDTHLWQHLRKCKFVRQKTDPDIPILKEAKSEYAKLQ